jgi:non-heme chloroperoxidase
MLKTEKNPGGLPIEVFDEMRQALSRDRSQFWEDVSKPFYGANREGAAVSRGVLDAFRLMSMQAGFKGPTTASKRSRRRT